MSIGTNSRNNYAAVMRVTNAAGYLVEREHLDIRPTLVAILYPDNQQYVPSSTDNWSRIAWRKLGSGKLWWVIADFSQVIDPFSELYPTTQNQYLTQLAASIPSGEVNTMQVFDATQMTQGMLLNVEDLNPSNKISFQCSITQVIKNTVGKGAPQTWTVNFTPVTCPSPGIPPTFSRVSQVKQSQALLTIPSPHVAFFNALSFANPLNTLVQ